MVATRKSPTHRPALAHRLDGSSDAYRLTSIKVRQVTTGTVDVKVRCDACGEPVRCAVDSPRARIRRRRWTRLAGYGVLALVGPIALAVALLFEPADVDGAVRVGVMVGFTCGVVGLALLSAWAELTSEHDGDEGVRLLGRHGPHSVLYAEDLIPGDHGKWYRRTGGGGFRDCNAEPLIGGSL